MQINLKLNLDDAQLERELAPLLKKGAVSTATVEVCCDSADPHAPRHRLSDTERRVLEALSRHDTIKGAAHALCLSPGTVRKHLEHIYFKLNVHSIHRAIAVVLRCGLIR